MPVIVDSDPGTVSALSAALPPGTHAVDSSERLSAWLTHRPAEYVVVLGPNLELDEAIAVCESMRYTRPSTSVVLVRKEIETEMLYRAMQAGCRDVVRAEDTAAISAAVARAQQLWQALHGESSS